MVAAGRMSWADAQHAAALYDAAANLLGLRGWLPHNRCIDGRTCPLTGPLCVLCAIQAAQLIGVLLPPAGETFDRNHHRHARITAYCRQTLLENLDRYPPADPTRTGGHIATLLVSLAARLRLASTPRPHDPTEQETTPS